MREAFRCSYHGGPNQVSHRVCEVFEIGVGRTGSRSVARAACWLGLEVRHGFSGCPGCIQDAVWKQRQGRCDLDLYQTCEYSGNVAAIHWPDLVESHPRAKWILTVRPVASWLASMQTNFQVQKHLQPAHRDSWTQLYLQHMWGGVENLARIRQRYLEYLARVRLHFHQFDNLLELNVFTEPSSQLWRRLAAFLDRPLPDPLPEFPRIKKCRVLYSSLEVR